MSNHTEAQKKTQPYEHDLASLKSSQQVSMTNTHRAPQEDEEPQEDSQLNQNISYSQHDEEEDPDAVPADKDKLIEYLKATLNKAEMTMGTLIVAIQIEKDKRDGLIGEIAERKNELDEIKDYEDNFLTEKVQDKMSIAIQRALEDKVLADNEVELVEKEKEELESAIRELDENVQNTHIEKCQKQVELEETQYKFNEQESLIENFNAELAKLNNHHTEKSKKISELTAEVDDMKGLIDTLVGAKDKLNYYLKDESPVRSRPSVRAVKTPQKPTLHQGEGVQKPNEDPMSYGSPQVFDTAERSSQPLQEDDFWYGESKNRQSKAPEERSSHERQPWQPKVQSYDMATGERAYNKTPERNHGMPAVRLPMISGGKAEYLYKNKEYIDEFGNSNSKTKKAQVQAKRKQY